ncbi:hypothetical protein GCM10010275_08340 [Streptomyces litmocidini]|nr:hypothetical protein GCM10010275_08340 [Streptomyces litmocidini]
MPGGCVKGADDGLWKTAVTVPGKRLSSRRPYGLVLLKWEKDRAVGLTTAVAHATTVEA